MTMAGPSYSGTDALSVGWLCFAAVGAEVVPTGQLAQILAIWECLRRLD
jgi:hypothetical protein